MYIYIYIYISGVDTAFRSLTDGRASRHIRDGTRTDRLAFCDLCDHREPSSTVRIKTRRMLYARARNACLTLMHGRCHTVQFHAPFHAWSSLARNFRLTSASIVLRDVSIWNLTFLKDIDIFIRLNNVDVLLIPRQEMFEKSWMAI